MLTRVTRLGVFASHPIQYQAPLYRRLATRGKVSVDVLFVSDVGLAGTVDPGFGLRLQWDIDLLAGYRNSFLNRKDEKRGRAQKIVALHSWIGKQDVVVVHGYASPWMLLAMILCKMLRKPYLLRGDSHPMGQSGRILRRPARRILARLAVAGSQGGLSIGRLNEDFYSKFGGKAYWAPFSVENERFATHQPPSKTELLTRYGLDVRRPVILFVGKMTAHKRPLDLVLAAERLQWRASLLMVGDGPLMKVAEQALPENRGAMAGFVNQAALPTYYQAADVLVVPSEREPWGLVVNEAMAAGVVPVVSDQVGAGHDLVEGVGRIYTCGDVGALAEALDDILWRSDFGSLRRRVLDRVEQYSLDRTAAGFETAALAVHNAR